MGGAEAAIGSSPSTSGRSDCGPRLWDGCEAMHGRGEAGKAVPRRPAAGDAAAANGRGPTSTTFYTAAAADKGKAASVAGKPSPAVAGRPTTHRLHHAGRRRPAPGQASVDLATYGVSAAFCLLATRQTSTAESRNMCMVLGLVFLAGTVAAARGGPGYARTRGRLAVALRLAFAAAHNPIVFANRHYKMVMPVHTWPAFFMARTGPLCSWCSTCRSASAAAAAWPRCWRHSGCCSR